MTNDELQLLKKELVHLRDAANIFERSYEICKKIEVKDKYPLEELDHFEALTARFARLSDLLIQKIFRLFDQLDLEPAGTVRDRINRAEKKELISKADELIDIRQLRNNISHEYMEDVMKKIFEKVMELTPTLLESVENAVHYAKKYH